MLLWFCCVLGVLGRLGHLVVELRKRLTFWMPSPITFSIPDSEDVLELGRGAAPTLPVLDRRGTAGLGRRRRRRRGFFGPAGRGGRPIRAQSARVPHSMRAHATTRRASWRGRVLPDAMVCSGRRVARVARRRLARARANWQHAASAAAERSRGARQHDADGGGRWRGGGSGDRCREGGGGRGVVRAWLVERSALSLRLSWLHA